MIGPLTHKEPKHIAEIRSSLHPREYRVFQGVVRKHQWPFWSRMFFHAFGGRFGDHREWPVIEAWADQIALVLLREVGMRESRHPEATPSGTPLAGRLPK
jgi:hypothetical protein